MGLNISPKHIVLDLYQSKHIMIQASQYDVDSRELIIHVTNDGEFFAVPQDYTASIEYKKADNTVGVVDCEILEDGTLSFVITEQMTAVAGYCTCDLMIVSNKQAINTAAFIINVRESAVTGDEVASSDEFTSLTRTVVRANTAIATINTMKDEFSEYIDESTEKVDHCMEQAERAQAIADQVDSAVVTAIAKAEETSTNAQAAASSASAAKTSETNAKASENNAETAENLAQIQAAEAQASADAAKASETASKTSETNAKASETAAKTSADIAMEYATCASNDAEVTIVKANAADRSANSAFQSATLASEKAAEMTDYADQSKSYAVGTGDVYRDGDSSDNAKYYYEQARNISEGLKGALLPMGTITFSQLESQSKVAGYMYNISDEFTTTANFKEGSGHTYPIGTNVYYTADGYWDCLAGTPVTGIKGNAETTYRKGNVNITPSNIGLGNVENKSSATIRGELTKSDVINALGYEPPTEGKTYEVATTTENGLMSATDKTTLDNLNTELPVLKKSVADGKELLANTISSYHEESFGDASNTFEELNTYLEEAVTFQKEESFGEGFSYGYCPNGTKWVQSNITSGVYMIAYGNGIFVAASLVDGCIYYSTDGKTWTLSSTFKSTSTSSYFINVVYGNGVFLAMESSGLIYGSTDGNIWENYYSTGTNATKIEYINGYFIVRIYPASYHFFFSTDGKTWTSISIRNEAYSSMLKYFAYGKGIWVANDYGYTATGYNLAYSTDLKTWIASDMTDGDGNFHLVVYGGDKFVAVCSDNSIYHSYDGKTWGLCSYDGLYVMDIHYADGMWVLAATDGLYYSEDGIEWTKCTFNGITNITYGCLNYRNGVWVALLLKGYFYSLDGKTWVNLNELITYYGSIECGKDTWVASGATNSWITQGYGIYYSPTWEQKSIE